MELAGIYLEDYWAFIWLRKIITKQEIIFYKQLNIFQVHLGCPLLVIFSISLEDLVWALLVDFLYLIASNTNNYLYQKSL